MASEKFDAPSWLDKEFLEELLRENDSDSSTVVTDFTVRPGVGKGENYSSCMHRVMVYITKKGGCTEKRTSLMVKSLPESEVLTRLLLEAGIVDREKRMYFDMFPALYKLQSTTEAATISPRAYRTTRPNTIVLEDLTQDGFKMADRHQGLDLEHAKVVLRAMARLHALSIGLAAQDPTSMDHFTEMMYTEAKKEQNKMFTNPSIGHLASIVETWDGYKAIAKKLREIEWVDLLTYLVKVKEGDLAVLNHGDCWTNNMLFKYNEAGEVNSVKFVDFQIGRYASPAFDILYFMNTSLTEVRRNHWDEVIQVYYDAVVETLKSIGCESKVFSLQKLEGEIEEKMLFGLFTACLVLPVTMADPEDAPDLSNVLVDNPESGANQAEFGKSYNSPRFREVLKQILEHYDARGLLDKPTHII